MVLVPTMRGNGNCGCSCGNLPYTVTVSLAGVAETDVQTAAPSYSLTSCTGSGAAAVATAASGEGCKASDTLVTGLTVTDGGCGYAVLGRKEPVLVASAPGGRGITFGKITLEPVSPADCSSSPSWTGLPQWKVTGIEATFDDQSGYGQDPIADLIVEEKVQLRAASGVLLTTGDIPINGITAAFKFEHELPVLSAVVRPYGNGSNGSGAQLSLTTTKITPAPGGGFDGNYWEVTSVAVDAGGDGYITGQVVDFVYGIDTYCTNVSVTGECGGAGTITANDTPPSKWLGITERKSDRRASGAVLELGWQQSTGGDGLQYWTADSVSVVNGGSRYTVGDAIIYRHRDGGRIRVAVSSVSSGGEIQSASITYAWPMLGEGGAVQSVAVTDAGSSHRLRVTGIGAIDATPIYQEDPSLPALVPPTVISPNCTHTATIDDKVGSATFGQVTAITVEDQEAWGQLTCFDREAAIGVPHVLRASNPKRLVTVEVSSCWGESTRACVDIRTTKRVAPDFPDDILIPLGVGCTPATVGYTLEEHEDENGDPYWSIDTVTASGGYGYGAERVWQHTVGLANLTGLPCGPRQANTSASPGYPADEAAGFFVPEPATLDITVLEDSSIGGVTVTNGGKYYRVAEYDGQPTGIKKAHATNPGYGYAKIGRDEPTLAIVNGPIGRDEIPSGLTVTPTLEQHTDNCNLPYWSIKSLSFSGGTGYRPGDPLVVNTLAFSPGTVEAEPAIMSVEADGWFESIEEPTLTPYVYGFDGTTSGDGAVLEATLSRRGQAWTVARVNVVNGGSGYEIGEYIWFEEYPNVTDDPPYFLVNDPSVNYNLAVTDVDPTGAIREVAGLGGAPWDGGGFFKQFTGDSSVTGIVLTSGGKYYHENKSLPSYVSATATIVQLPPSVGSGASISLQVHDDPNVPSTFGRIKSAKVDDEGSGYTLLGGPMDCTYAGHCVSLDIQGPHEPLRIHAAESSLLSTAALEDCGALPSAATVQYGNDVASASITAGGVWGSCPTRDCGCDTNGCCTKDDDYIEAADSCDCAEQAGEWVTGRDCGCCCVDGEFYAGIYDDGVASPETLTPCKCSEIGGTWLDGKDCSSECLCNTPNVFDCIVTVNGSTNVSWTDYYDPPRIEVVAYVPVGESDAVQLSASASLTVVNCEYQIGEFTVETEGDFEITASCNPLP